MLVMWQELMFADDMIDFRKTISVIRKSEKSDDQSDTSLFKELNASSTRGAVKYLQV